MTLLDSFGDPTIDPLLTADVRFRSPYADYQGREEVGRLFGLIRDVLEEVEPAVQVGEDGQTVTVFDARVPGADVQGMLYERRDGDGRLVEAMLTLRPYAGLRAAMAAMKERMDAAR